MDVEVALKALKWGAVVLLHFLVLMMLHRLISSRDADKDNTDV